MRVEENTRSAPRTPPSTNKLAMQHKDKSSFQKDFQKRTTAPSDSKNELGRHSPVENSVVQNQMPFVHENENREIGQQPFSI